jgi:hypothetical protein
MRRIEVTMAMVMAASSAARAEDAQPQPRITVGGSMTVWLPQDDADDLSDPSIGVRPQLTFWVLPQVGISASFDWVFVNEEDGSDDTTYYVVSVGGRATMARPLRVKPYGELMLGWHKLETTNVDESDLGFRLGGGALIELGSNAIATAGIGYSTVTIDTGLFGIEVDIEAFVFELGAGGRF